eukprot:Hpha_TRINITY_DN30390_c0_g1::TRINITY_DN30390_c0_g1_i1::g.147150::m.147150
MMGSQLQFCFAALLVMMGPQVTKAEGGEEKELTQVTMDTHPADGAQHQGDQQKEKERRKRRKRSKAQDNGTHSTVRKTPVGKVARNYPASQVEQGMDDWAGVPGVDYIATNVRMVGSLDVLPTVDTVERLNTTVLALDNLSYWLLNKTSNGTQAHLRQMQAHRVPAPPLAKPRAIETLEWGAEVFSRLTNWLSADLNTVYALALAAAPSRRGAYWRPLSAAATQIALLCPPVALTPAYSRFPGARRLGQIPLPRRARVKSDASTTTDTAAT